MAKKKSSFEEARSTVLGAIRRFEKAVMEMVGGEEAPSSDNRKKRKTKKRKSKGRGR